VGSGHALVVALGETKEGAMETLVLDGAADLSTNHAVDSEGESAVRASGWVDSRHTRGRLHCEQNECPAHTQLY
jgi:hypothetical protein